MRRLSKNNKKRRIALRIDLERHRHRVKRKRLQRERQALKNGQVPARLSKVPTLLVPSIVAIDQPHSRGELMKFLRVFRSLVVQKKKPVILDFSRTTQMVSCGTLLLLAETLRIRLVTKRLIKIRCRRVNDSKVNQVLHHIGFYAAIGQRSRIRPTAADVIHWRAISGQGAEGEKANSLVQNVGSRLPASLESPMYDGLVEAMTNSTQHAYLRPRRDGLGVRGKGDWWMFAKEQDGRVSVVFCDLGIGIPNSLPLTHGDGAVRQLVARLGRASGMVLTDAALVGAAVEMGRSRTRAAHRGKGLQDVLDVIDRAKTGVLKIHSNAGCYTYQVRDGKTQIQYRNYRSSIMGTLIQWNVPIRMTEAGL